MFNSSHNPQIQNSVLQYTNTTCHKLGVSKGFDTLTKAVAPNAFHNSDDRPDPPKCHENTRVAVINKIMDWVTGKIDTDALILWLYGPAGAGKSAIARTVAELCAARQLLLASFFFFRTDPRRNTMKPLVANIAYRTTLSIPASRPLIETIVEMDPLVLECDLDVQLTRLLVEPLRQLFETGSFSDNPFPPLIVIDGLDECVDENAQSKLIKILSSTLQQSKLPCKVLVASRAEPHIKFAFNILQPSIVSHLELNNDFRPDKDIRQFLVDKFDEIKRSHPFRTRIPSSPWPSEEQLDSLVRKASGQFIYASIVARFIDAPRHLPAQRLDSILDLQTPYHDLPFAELDQLYAYILSRVSDMTLVLRILGIEIALLRTRPSQPLTLVEGILALGDGKASFALADLHSLLETTESGRLVFHHSSFIDFLLSRQRSTHHYIDVRRCHTTILQRVLQTFRRSGLESDKVHFGRWHSVDLAGHLRESLPTTDLQTDLEGFALEVYMQRKVDIGYIATWVVREAKQFLNALEEINRPELHRHHAALLQTFITSSLDNCPGSDVEGSMKQATT